MQFMETYFEYGVQISLKYFLESSLFLKLFLNKSEWEVAPSMNWLKMWNYD